MATLAHRIRQARRVAGLSQALLAERLDVNRSAVAQWERTDGSKPTTQHLAAIAVETGASFEWLATGRGRIRPHADGPGEPGALLLNHYAQDSLEERLLVAFRLLGIRRQIPLIEFLERLGADEDG